MDVLISGWFWGEKQTGSGQYLHRLFDALHEIAPRDRFRLLLKPNARAAPPGALAARLRLRGNLTKLWFEQVTAPRAAAASGASVLHVPYWAPPAFSPVPTVVTIHDLIPRILPEYRGNLMVRTYTALVSLTARRAALILTDSEASRRDIMSHLGIPSDRVRRIWLAADRRYRPSNREEMDRVRRKYGLPRSYLLYLGGFDVRKNLRTLVEAWKMAGLQDVNLVVAGKLPGKDSPFTPDPRRLAAEAGAEGIVFPGWIDEEDKPGVYSGATAFLFPSIYEGFGLPVLEAMSCRTPVIASDSSSLPEIVGTAGLLLPPTEPERWAEAMISIVTDPDLRDRLAAEALERAAMFDWEKTARQTYLAYAEAAGEAPQA